MSLFLSHRFRLSSLSLAVLGASASSFAQSNDLGLEAIVAPQLSRSFGEQPRTRIGLDFYRVSAGGSLLAQYGTGEGLVDYSLTFRLSALKQFFGEPFSRGFIYGIGLGITGSPGVAKELTNTDKKAGYSDLVVNPYLRYLFDINGWVGPYLEFGYEFAAKRFKWAAAYEPLEPGAGVWNLGFGIALEAER
jgi:hypothetical protein